MAIAGADSPSTNPGDSGALEPDAPDGFVLPGEGVSSTDPPTTTSRSSSRSCLAGPTTALGRSSTATTASWRFAAARSIHDIPTSCLMSVSLNVFPSPSSGLFQTNPNRFCRSAVTSICSIFATSASRCGTYSSAAAERASASRGSLATPLNAHSVRRFELSARTSDNVRDSWLEISFSNAKGSVTSPPAKSKGGSIAAAPARTEQWRATSRTTLLKE